MNSEPVGVPRVFNIQATELQLSGQELIELMRVKLASSLPIRFQARGWSMSPFIRDHDSITIASLDGLLPGIGEIVAFTRPESGNLVVHRVVARQGVNSLIQADGSTECSDGMIPPTNLLGRVIRIERNGHKVWLGLGPERYLIAWLSRFRLLVPLRVWLAAWRNRILHRQ